MNPSTKEGVSTMSEDSSTEKRDIYQLAIDREKLFMYWANIAKETDPETRYLPANQKVKAFDTWLEKNDLDYDNPPNNPETLGLHNH